MRNDHDVDRLRVDAGGLQVGMKLAGRSFAALEVRLAGAGVDDARAWSRCSRRSANTGSPSCPFPCRRRPARVHLVAALVDDESVGKTEPVDAVGDDGHFVRADLVAIPAGRLLAGRRRGGDSPAKSQYGVVAVAAAAATAPVSTVRLVTSVIMAFLWVTASRLGWRKRSKRC